MRIFFRLLFIILMSIIGVSEVWLFKYSYLYHQAQKTEESMEKVSILERANPSRYADDQLFNELGKAYFDLGIQNLENGEESLTYLKKAIENFRFSIKINTASEFNHFNLGQALLYAKALSPGFKGDPYEEYKKASLLAGYNSQLFLEVGKIFLSRWDILSRDDKDMTREMLKKILEGKNTEKLQTLLPFWEMNIGDYDFIEGILPEDPEIYRSYARFLGEKSLSRERRQNFMAAAESLEFQNAQRLLEEGENDLLYLRLEKAFDHFNTGLAVLERIRFYQDLVDQKLIDPMDFLQLKTMIYLNLARSRIYGGAKLKDVKEYLKGYLDLETQTSFVGNLEDFLKDRGLLKGKLTSNLDDLELLSFKLFLFFKLNRYREIMRLGRLLEQSIVVIPTERRKEYAQMLRIVGDACQKFDNIYDAGEFYQKSHDADPQNIGTLVRLLQNYKRRNEEEKVRQTRMKIDNLVSPEDINRGNENLQKGQEYVKRLIMDGNEIITEMHVERTPDERDPLISVFFNDLVIWEDYLTSDVLWLPLKPKIGMNTLVVVPVNRPVSLVKLTYRKVQ